MENTSTGKSPAFQFYPKDFVTGTLTLTTYEVGAYMLLICYCWDNGCIPSDLGAMSRIARVTPMQMRRMWAALSDKFQAVEGGYIQPRIEIERQKQVEYRRRQADNGHKGGRPRKTTDNPQETQTKAVGFETESQTEAKKSSPVSDLRSSSSDFSQNKSATRIDWFEECQKLHDGKCGGSRRHETQMILDAAKGKAAS